MGGSPSWRRRTPPEVFKHFQKSSVLKTPPNRAALHLNAIFGGARRRSVPFAVIKLYLCYGDRTTPPNPDLGNQHCTGAPPSNGAPS